MKYLYHYIFISILITIMIYVSWLIWLSDKTKGIEVVSLFIGFMSVFATGYGAYLGAKIAGDNALKVLKDDLIMTEYREKVNNNLQFLDKYEKEMSFFSSQNDNIKITNITEFIISYNKFKYLAERVDKLKSENFDTSQIIKYPFENQVSLIAVTKILFEETYNFMMNTVRSHIKDEYKFDYDFYVSLKSFDLWKLTENMMRNEYIEIEYSIYEVVPFDFNKMEEIVQDKWKFDDTQIFNIKKLNRLIISENEMNIIRLNDLINKIYASYQSITFKNRNELMDYIIKYYNVRNN